MKKKVIVAGHICLDITPVFPIGKKSELTKILVPGELIQVNGADVHTGGAVANTGLALKLLGADVSLIAKVGKDSFGEIICNILKQYHAEENLITAEGETTSFSVVLAVPGNDRIFLHNPGANQCFYADDLTDALLEEASLLHFGYPTLMKSLYENSGAELVALMEKVKKHQVATSLDLSAIDEMTEAGRVNWDEILKKVIPLTDFFLPSAEELCFMLDRSRFHEWKNRAGGGDVTEILNIERDIRPLAEKCMSYGAKILLIKCGAAGIYYRTAGEKVLNKIGQKVKLKTDLWENREGFEKSYVPEKILSATGAGDTCIAAFLLAMLEDYPLTSCMQFATATGANCVASYDALGGIKTLSKLSQQIENGWKKVDGI